MLFHYDEAEDPEAAARLAADCASHVNDACESQRVHAVVLDGTIAVEPLDWTKSTAAHKVFEKLNSQASAKGGDNKPVDFLMVVGDGREDEKVFKWANKLDKRGVVDNVMTVSLGNRSTEAAATLTQGVSGTLMTMSNILEKAQMLIAETGVLSCLQRLASL